MRIEYDRDELELLESIEKGEWKSIDINGRLIDINVLEQLNGRK